MQRENRGRQFFAALIVLLLTWCGAQATTYSTQEDLAKRLTALRKTEPDVVRLQVLATSLEGREISLAELGTGSGQERSSRPALLVVGGIEGNDLVGSTLVLSWIEDLIDRYPDDPNVASLLDTTTIYAVCRLNPDAAEQFFASPKRETSVNGQPHDDDHDALTDEDGGEDLNGDGLITMMRVENNEGTYVLDLQDDRLLIEADPLKGEVGRWRYLSEGIDNDHDELWNEDGPGGVNFNRNFPFDYAFFAPDAGLYPVCTAPTRALADFIVRHPNIGIVMTYGAADNLLKTPKDAKAPERRNPLTAVDAEDVSTYRALGESYRETLGLDKELEGASSPGTFSDWMYFHRGRLSLAARPWSPELALALSKDDRSDDEAKDKDDEKDKAKKTKDEDKRGKDARSQLAWFDTHAPEAFRPWQVIDHPDFPGQRVEVGGYAPFALTHPPESMLADLVAAQGRFLTELAGRLPRIAVQQVRCRHLGESIFEIEMRVENTGFLPTALSQGERTREVYPTRLILDVQPEQLLAGTRITNLPTLAGSGGAAKVRWTVHAPDQSEIGFEIISMLSGHVEGTIDLRDPVIY